MNNSITPNTDPLPEVHPLCLLLPDMTEEEFTNLKTDIEKNGLHFPILLHPNGQILDGRHRARACQDLGVEAHFETWRGTDPVAFVLSGNLHRRHLTASQRAMVAAQAMEHHKAQAEARMKAGRTLASEDATPQAKGKAAGTAATAAGVSQATIERAAAIVRDGTPEDIKAVVDGKATVAAKAQEVKARAYTGHFPEAARRIQDTGIDDAEVVVDPPEVPTTRPVVTGYLKAHGAQAAHLLKVAKDLRSAVGEYSRTPTAEVLALLADIRESAERLERSIGKMEVSA